MMLGPKITVVTKYGGKFSLRYPLSTWLLDREFAKSIKEMVHNSWKNFDTQTFRSGCNVIRVNEKNAGLIKLSWF